MPRSYILYLRDILDRTRRIKLYLRDVDYEEFSRHGMVTDATLYCILVIGEAVKHVPDTVRAKYPAVNWRGIAGFRDITAHEYFRVNMDIAWSITQENIPELENQIIAILEQEDDPHSA